MHQTISVKSFRIPALILGILAAFFLSFNLASAVTFPQNVTMTLTISGVSKNFTIEAGSEAASLVVNTSSFVVTASAGHRFVVNSTDKYNFTNDSTFSTTCTSGSSAVDITVAAGGTAKVVTVTPDGTTCTSGGGGGGSSGSSTTTTGGGGGAISTTTTPTPTPASTATPAPASQASTASPAAYGLKEGDVVSASGSDDPDVYIINIYGYKRLFLNPVIFNFYGHLGGFSKVKKIVSTTRNAFVTSGLFRNCEANDPKVYGVEVSGEDTGILHWINMSGAQAVAEDPNFFKKVFCINNNEFNWYAKGSAYTALSQVPAYTRSSAPTSVPSAINKVKVVSTVSYLNVRSGNSTSAAIVGKVYPGEEYVYTEIKNGWYKIQKDGKDFGWVSGQYVK